MERLGPGGDGPQDEGGLGLPEASVCREGRNFPTGRLRVRCENPKPSAPIGTDGHFCKPLDRNSETNLMRYVTNRRGTVANSRESVGLSGKAIIQDAPGCE